MIDDCDEDRGYESNRGQHSIDVLWCSKSKSLDSKVLGDNWKFAVAADGGGQHDGAAAENCTGKMSMSS